MEANGLTKKLKLLFDETKRKNPNLSLDEILYAVYKEVKEDYDATFDALRNEILKANEIDELEYYTKDVNQELKNI